MPRVALTPTWWLLVQLDLPELSGYRLRAIGPLSWTDVRALGARWEQAFGAGTTAFTERPTARRVDVGVRVEQPAAVPAPASVSIEPPRVVTARVARSKPARPAPVPAKPAQRRAPGQSRLSERARAALARTAAARAAIDASIAGLTEGL